jgi:carbohydrate diacid regulator
MTGAASRQPISPQLIHAIIESVIDKVHPDPRIEQPQKDQLFDDLLQGRFMDETLILQQAKTLGIHLTPPRAVILVNAAEYVLQNGQVHDSAQAEVRRAQRLINVIVNFFHLPNDTICADLGAGTICILKASDTKNLDLWANAATEKRSDSSWANLTALKRAANELRLRLELETGCPIQIGIGRYHPGLKGLARSYEDARVALSLGSRLQKFDRVHCLAELGIAAFVGVADETTKVELARYLLGPLDYEPDLLTTINTFFAENCCSSSTAKRLYIHRNTLNYRLEKIASLTGLDPRNFDDAIQIRISLLLRTLNPALQ